MLREVSGIKSVMILINDLETSVGFAGQRDNCNATKSGIMMMKITFKNYRALLPYAEIVIRSSILEDLEYWQWMENWILTI